MALVFASVVVRFVMSELERLDVLYDSLAQEKAATERTILALDRVRIGEVVEDLSTWEPLSRFTENPNSNWAKSNLQTYVRTGLVDAVLVFDHSKKPIYQFYKNPSGWRFSPSSTMIERFSRLGGTNIGFEPGDRFPVEVFGGTINPNQDSRQTGESVGTLIFVRYWNDAQLERLSTMLGSDLSITDSVRESRVTDADREASMVVSSSAMGDIDSQAVGYLKSERRSASLAALRSGANRSFGIYMALASTTLILGFALLVPWVAWPVKRLRSALDRGNAAPIRNLIGRGSDFGRLATALADFLKQRNELSEEVARRRQVEEELTLALDRAEEANRAKSRFLATMSHEIRTPMNGVLGMSELLRAAPRGEHAPVYAEAIETSAQSLLRILNDVLDFSKIEAGKMMLLEEEFNLRPIFEDAARLFAPTAAAKNVDFVCDVRPDLPPRGIVDPTKLRQIVMNLVGNAMKFTDQGEILLRVHTYPEPERRIRITIEVKDTGLGIPERDLKAIFETFDQGTQGARNRMGGTGLGLPIARSLCRLMDGDLTVASVEGEGSTFTATVIVRQSPVVGSDIKVNAGRTAWIVEPRRHYREAVAALLRSFGWKVEEYEHMPPPNQECPDYAFVSDGVGEPWVNCSQTKWVLVRRLGYPSALNRSSWDAELAHPLRWLDLAIIADVMPSTNINFAPTTSRPLEGLRILLVEDNSVNRYLARTLLNNWECVVTEAQNGLEAVHMAKRLTFDVVLMDLHMPEMDGLEATRRIRIFSSVPILAVTANASEEDRLACLQAGMDDFVAKPFRATELESALSNYRRVGV
ncbi:response regulator [bacterium]|nr:MAG: response regulator [bacterium]